MGPITSVETPRWDATGKMADGPLYVRYRSTGRIGIHGLRRDVIVYRDEPRIEFRNSVVWQGDEGFLTVEWPGLPAGTLYGDTPFGVEEKDMEKEPFQYIERQRKNMFFAKSFLACSEENRTVCYFNEDATHYWLSNRETLANILLNGVTRSSGWERFVAEETDAVGRHLFISHLLFSRGDRRKTNLVRKSREVFTRSETFFFDRPSGGQLPREHSFLSLTPSCLEMTAFHRQGGKHIVRFYETEGRKTRATICLPFQTAQAVKADLEGNRLERLRAGRGVVICGVGPREIVTVAVTPRGSRSSLPSGRP